MDYQKTINMFSGNVSPLHDGEDENLTQRLKNMTIDTEEMVTFNRTTEKEYYKKLCNQFSADLNKLNVRHPTAD